MNALIETLQRAGRDLTDLGSRWCLVGGIAVSTRTEPRFTRNVDFVVAVADDATAERLVFDLQQRGWNAQVVLEHSEHDRLSTVRLSLGREDAGVVIDLLFASSGIESEVVEAAEPIEIIAGVTAPVARLGHLIALKLLARTDDRPQDGIDLANLCAAATPTDLDDARHAIALITKREYHRNRDLAADLASLG